MPARTVGNEFVVPGRRQHASIVQHNAIRRVHKAQPPGARSVRTLSGRTSDMIENGLVRQQPRYALS